jgi:hypothetical protein
MTTANGIRDQVKTNQKKEQNMNARKVVCVVCVLVVGLATALEFTALAGPPSVDYKPGFNLIYRGAAFNVAPKVSVPLYQAGDSKLPSFLGGWTATSSVQNLHPLFHYPLDNNLAPAVQVPTYSWSSTRLSDLF